MTRQSQPPPSRDPGSERLGFFGGTFDPPHRGHVALARAAAVVFALDRVLFVPTGRQPLKPGDGSASWPDRLAMCRLLERLDARFAVSAMDGPHPDGSPNYTVDTLRELRAAHPTATVFSLIGADAFLQLRQWREPGALFALAEWIVVSRPGSPAQPRRARADRAGPPPRAHRPAARPGPPAAPPA